MKFEMFFDSDIKSNADDVVISISAKIGNGKSYFASNILNLLSHLRVKKAKVYEINPDNRVVIVFKRPNNFKLVKNHINKKYTNMKFHYLESKLEEFRNDPDKNSFKNVFERGFIL